MRRDSYFLTDHTATSSLNASQHLTETQKTAKRGDKEVADRKKLLSVAGSKKVKQAKKIIEGAAEGLFPTL